jgi:hypothetical protein
MVSLPSVKCVENYEKYAESDFLSFVPFTYQKKETADLHIPELGPKQANNHS